MFTYRTVFDTPLFVLETLLILISNWYVENVPIGIGLFFISDMKIGLLALFVLGAAPVNAHHFQNGYSHSETCTKTIYREEYIAGTIHSQGYVKSWHVTVQVPCSGSKNILILIPVIIALYTVPVIPHLKLKVAMPIERQVV